MLKLADTIYRTEQRIDRWEVANPNQFDDGVDSLRWDNWLKRLYPATFAYPFTTRHVEFWQWVEALERGVKPAAFFGIWPRAGGKSTNAEGAAIRIGAKEKRKFCLYVRGIQDKANESVQNIATMLETQRAYPALSERKLGKYGNSKGWRVDTLRCANGFNVVALGFDAAVRGIKIEEFRPDLIILDDIDSLDDSLEATNKKIATLTKSILPAGSDDCAVVGIQNLVKWNGVFDQVANGKADFLLNRIVSGPYPAIENLAYEKRDGKYFITGGIATWQGQDIEICQNQMNDWGIEAFLSEAQHEVHKRTGRVYHAFTNIAPPASELDYSKVSGYYHSHDFGAVNHVWGLWAKIGKAYYLVHEAKLPEGTTEARAEAIKAVWGDKRIVAGWGGALSEKQYRLDFQNHGISIRTPPNVLKSVQDEIVASQVRNTNEQFEDGKLMICEDMVYTIDQLQNCIYADNEKIADKATFHFADMVRYFAAGISRSGWAR